MNNKGITLDPESKRFRVENGGGAMVQENETDLEELEEETETQKIDTLLDQGYSLGRLVKMGFARSTVRQRLKKRAKTNPPNNGEENGRAEVSLTIKDKEQVLPEWLEGQVGELYDGDEKTRKIFMAGMSIPLLGMRLFAESFKPMLALMQTHSQGMAEAAKAAQGGSEDVAQQTVISSLPYFKDMITEVSRNQAQNPMQSMMVRMMEPMLTGVVSNLMGGMFKQPGQDQPGQGQSSLPPGWTRSEEK